MLIEVKETHPPKAGKKVATVVSTTGERFEIWPDKLAGIQVGRSYEVQTDDRQWEGRTFRKITKATPVNGAAPAAAPATAPAPTANGEGEYVGRAIHALILKGEVTFKNLENVTAQLRLYWANTSPEGAYYRQAAE